MKPMTFTIPAADCVVTDAQLSCIAEDSWILNLRMTLRCEPIVEVIKGKAIFDLVFELCWRLGFAVQDANRIIEIARGNTPRVNPLLN